MPPPKKSGGEGSKKAQGQSRKADAAAAKQAEKDSAAAAEEAKKWDVGGKSNSKAYVCNYRHRFQCADMNTARPQQRRKRKPRARRPRRMPS